MFLYNCDGFPFNYMRVFFLINGENYESFKPFKVFS